jgi:hypothetical protein
MEYCAAVALLALSPDSPWHRRSVWFAGEIECGMAAVPEKMHKAAQPSIEAAVDVGDSLTY